MSGGRPSDRVRPAWDGELPGGREVLASAHLGFLYLVVTMIFLVAAPFTALAEDPGTAFVAALVLWLLVCAYIRWFDRNLVVIDNKGIVVVARGKPKLSFDWDQVEEARWHAGSFWLNPSPDGAGIMVERRRQPPLFRRQPMEQVGSVLILWPSERARIAERAEQLLARHVPLYGRVPPGQTRFDT